MIVQPGVEPMDRFTALILTLELCVQRGELPRGEMEAAAVHIPHLAQTDRQRVQEPRPRPRAPPPAGQAALDTGRGGSVVLLGHKTSFAAIL